MEVLIVTGVSGAGKTCVSNALEDVGFFCIDNVPAKLIAEVIKLLSVDEKYSKVAIVTDIRAGISCKDFSFALCEIKKLAIPFKTLFVDCRNDILFSRFKQSRRLHPLISEACSDVMSAITEERAVLQSVRDMCDLFLDTSELSPAVCKSRVTEMLSQKVTSSLKIHCMSFGFKHGVPADADFVFDLRFLPNPYYVPELKELTGLDSVVSDYVMQFDTAKKYLTYIKNIIDFAIPECIKEGRSQLIIAIGCTGGHHRSVTFVQLIDEYLKNEGYSITVSHRDILK